MRRRNRRDDLWEGLEVLQANPSQPVAWLWQKESGKRTKQIYKSAFCQSEPRLCGL